jgi:hypothetical protein
MNRRGSLPKSRPVARRWLSFIEPLGPLCETFASGTA